MLRNTGRVAALCAVVAALALLPGCDTLPSSAFSYTSQPGDPIGRGQSRTAPLGATYSVSGTSAYLTANIDWTDDTGSHDWTVILAAAKGQKLVPSVYYRAERAPLRTGTAPGLDVSGDGLGCNTLSGTFYLNQITTDASDDVTGIDATFEQHCHMVTPALTGRIVVNALPLSYVSDSSTGDFVGGGVTRTYEGSTSLFGLSGTASSLRFTAEGMGDEWTALIQAPTGQTLSPGTYSTTTSPDATRAALYVYGNGRGCKETFGTLHIDQLTVNGPGNVTKLSATFVQHCDTPTAPPLNGTIHYYA